MIKKIFTATMIVFFCTSMAMAGERIQKKEQKKDKLKDGSCQTSLISDVDNGWLAADRIQKKQQKKDKLKDGSCQS